MGGGGGAAAPPAEPAHPGAGGGGAAWGAALPGPKSGCAAGHTHTHTPARSPPPRHAPAGTDKAGGSRCRCAARPGGWRLGWPPPRPGRGHGSGGWGAALTLPPAEPAAPPPRAARGASRRRGGAERAHCVIAAAAAAMMLRRPAARPRPLPAAAPAPPPPPAAARSVVTAVPLAHAVLGGRGDRPPLVLLHGLFGSRGNFQTVAKALVRGGSGKAGADAGRPEPRRQPPQPADDLRSHEPGRAAPPDPPGHRQVHPAGTQHGGQDGHDAGLAADISPVSTAPVSEFSAYISAMKLVKIPEGLSRSAARQLADDQLRPVVQLPQLRQFLLTNLVEVEGRYVWRVNLEAISHHLADIMNFPVFHKPYPGPALFLGGSNSPYISSKHYPEIQRLFPKADVQHIEGAGHIVHQDKFEEFITAVLNFLPPP
ncbi:sn-1-specific diacylglycerol lipase ABHD11 isoform 2-T3 [Alca torda]